MPVLPLSLSLSPLAALPLPVFAVRYLALLQWIILTVRSQLVSVEERRPEIISVIPTPFISVVAIVVLSFMIIPSDCRDKREEKVIG